MLTVYSKIVPSTLNYDQNERHQRVYKNIIKRLQTRPDLFCKVITNNISEQDF